MRLKYLWAMAFSIAFIVSGCNTQNTEPPPTKQKAEAKTELPANPMSPKAMPPGEMPTGHPPIGKAPATPVPPGENLTITGTITLAPELASKASPDAVLYIMARQPGAKAPVAVARLTGVSFPLNYTLGQQHMMNPQSYFQGKVDISSRLDKDGYVGPPQPGDIEGSYKKNPVSVGDTKVDFTLDKSY